MKTMMALVVMGLCVRAAIGADTLPATTKAATASPATTTAATSIATQSTTRAAIVPATAPASAQAIPAGRYALGLKLEKGQAFFVDMTMSNEINQVLQKSQGKVAQKLSVTTSTRYSVENVVDGIHTIRVTFAGMRFESDSGAVKLKGDSSDPAGKTWADKICQGVVGKSFEMEIDQYGYLRKVIGAKEFLESIADEVAKDTAQTKAAVLNQAGALLGENQLAQNYGVPLRVFPGGPPAIGEYWKTPSPAAYGAFYGSTITHTLTGVNNGLASISTDGILLSAEAGEKKNTAAALLVTRVGGTCKGSVTVDLATGALTYYTTEHEAAGIMNIQFLDKTTEDSFMKIRMSMTMTMKKAK